LGKIKKSSGMAAKFGALALGAYVPQFFRIHLRYMKHNFRTWAALFVAPFLAVKLSIIALFEALAEDGDGLWRFDIIAIFVVALCFVMAERHRSFRRVYVYAVPIVMTLGLLYWAGGNGGYTNMGYLVKAALIGIFTQRVGKFTITHGYQQLSEGADKDYSQGRDHYKHAEYALAMPLLETSAGRGHFKSLYLLGDAYEHGHFYARDPVKAAEYFMKSARKGYSKANKRHEQLLDTLSPEQRKRLEGQWGL